MKLVFFDVCMLAEKQTHILDSILRGILAYYCLWGNFPNEVCW
ncbi:hypothetical protein [Vibrio sp. STUT-A11]|nr:hypothetical protein [Vibrio sp. STUT-A11]